MKLEKAAIQLEALGNPTRLAIYRILIQAGKKGITVGDVRKRLDIPASTLSHHIAKLMYAGLIIQERAGRILNCKADYKNMDALMTYMLHNCCSEDSSVRAA